MPLIVQIDTKAYQFFLLAFSIFVLVLSCFNFSYYSSIVSQYVAEPNKPQDVGSNWATAMKWINLTLIILSALMIIYSIYKLIKIFTEGEKDSNGEILKGTKNETAKDTSDAMTAAGVSKPIAAASAEAAAGALTTSVAGGATPADAADAAKGAAEDAATAAGATPTEAKKAGEVAAAAAKAAYDRTMKSLDAIGLRFPATKGYISGVWRVIYEKLKSSGASEDAARKGAAAGAAAAPPAGPDGAPPTGGGLDASIAVMESEAEKGSGMRIDWSGFSEKLKSLGGKVGTAGTSLYNSTIAALMANGKNAGEAAKLAGELLAKLQTSEPMPDWFIALQTKYYLRRPEFFGQGYEETPYPVRRLNSKNGYSSTAVSPTLIAGTLGAAVNFGNDMSQRIDNWKAKDTGRTLKGIVKDIDASELFEYQTGFCGAPDLTGLSDDKKKFNENCADDIRNRLYDEDVKGACDENNFTKACYIANVKKRQPIFTGPFKSSIDNNCNDPSASALPESKQAFCKVAIKAKRDNPEVYEACYINNQFENACNAASNLVALDEYAASDALRDSRYAMIQASIAQSEAS